MQTTSAVVPAARICSTSRSLRMICSVVYFFRFTVLPPGLFGRKALITGGLVHGGQTISASRSLARASRLGGIPVELGMPAVL